VPQRRPGGDGVDERFGHAADHHHGQRQLGRQRRQLGPPAADDGIGHAVAGRAQERLGVVDDADHEGVERQRPLGVTRTRARPVDDFRRARLRDHALRGRRQ
jgi:hypothetical protein